MKKLLLVVIVLSLLACVPKYASDGGNVTMEGYAVTETTYDPAGKIIRKKTMVPARSEWAKMIDNLVQEFSGFIGLTDIQVMK